VAKANQRSNFLEGGRGVTEGRRDQTLDEGGENGDSFIIDTPLRIEWAEKKMEERVKPIFEPTLGNRPRSKKEITSSEGPGGDAESAYSGRKG